MLLIFLKVVAYAVIPLVMAWAGNHLAAEGVQDPKRRRMYRVAFVVLALIGIGLTTAIEVASDKAHTKEFDAQKRQEDRLEGRIESLQIQNASDTGYLKAKLEDALGHPQADIGKQIVASNAELIKHEVAKLSKEDLVQSALALTKRMRECEIRHKGIESNIRADYWDKMHGTSAGDISKLAMEERFNTDVARRGYESECGSLMGEAVYFKDAIERKLKTPPPKSERGELAAFQGIFAGPAPVQDAATYLEVIARQLASQ